MLYCICLSEKHIENFMFCGVGFSDRDGRDESYYVFMKSAFHAHRKQLGFEMIGYVQVLYFICFITEYISNEDKVGF